MEKSNYWVHLCPNLEDRTCAFRSPDDGEVFLTATFSDLRPDLNFTDWLVRAQEQSPERVGYHALEWNCHHFAQDLWNAAVSPHLYFASSPNQNVLWLYRRLLTRFGGQGASDDVPLAENWLQDHMQRRRLAIPMFVRRVVAYMLRNALKKLARNTGKIARRRAIKNHQKAVANPGTRVPRDLGSKSNQTMMEDSVRRIRSAYNAMKKVRNTQKAAERLASCFYEGRPSSEVQSVLQQCFEETSLVPTLRCDSNGTIAFKLLLDVKDPSAEISGSEEEWRTYVREAEVTFEYKLGDSDLECNGSMEIFGLDPVSYSWDGDRFAYNGKQIINMPRPAEFRVTRRLAAHAENADPGDRIPEVCVGSSVQDGCPRRASCNTQKIGGSCESRTELCTSCATQKQQGDSKSTVHLIPRSGETLQDSASKQLWQVGRVEWPEIVSSTLSSGQSPPHSKSESCSVVDSQEMSSSCPSLESCSPWSYSSRCGSCDSWHASSGSCWDTDLMHSSGSFSMSSWRSSPESCENSLASSGPFSFCKSCPSCESFLGTSPFTKTSCGVTATDVDCSGTADSTGSWGAHKQCWLTKEAS